MKKKLTKNQKDALIILGSVGVIFGLGIWIGFDIGSLDKKIFDSIIETSKETEQAVSIMRDGVRIYIVPEAIS